MQTANTTPLRRFVSLGVGHSTFASFGLVLNPHAGQCIAHFEHLVGFLPFNTRPAQTFYYLVEFEQYLPLLGIAYEAAHPTDNGQPLAACHFGDVMQAGGGIE